MAHPGLMDSTLLAENRSVSACDDQASSEILT